MLSVLPTTAELARTENRYALSWNCLGQQPREQPRDHRVDDAVARERTGQPAARAGPARPAFDHKPVLGLHAPPQSPAATSRTSDARQGYSALRLPKRAR